MGARPAASPRRLNVASDLPSAKSKTVAGGRRKKGGFTSSNLGQGRCRLGMSGGERFKLCLMTCGAV